VGKIRRKNTITKKQKKNRTRQNKETKKGHIMKLEFGVRKEAEKKQIYRKKKSCAKGKK
jgi:hypothetical protein